MGPLFFYFRPQFLMNPKESRRPNRFGLSAFLLLGFLLFFIYSNTFDASWTLDDYNNIVGNPLVHAEASQPGSIIKPFGPLLDTGHLRRPFAYFTFAINWYWGKDNPRGYHLVNIFIHLLAAFFLFRAIQVLFETPRLYGLWQPSRIEFISLLAAVLWAINPIQVQSITYIVQRMASLCGLFYILSIYFYVRARLSDNPRKRYLRFAACGISFLLGFFTKENAATLPLSLMLIEAVFFQDLGKKIIRWRFLGLIAASVLVLAAGGMLLFFKNDIFDLFAGYNVRYFTPLERILTQPRILLFYLSLIFYPSPARLSMVHDIDVSTSLLAPWTTLASIAVIMGAVTLSIFKMRKWPVASFAVLFFFLTHAIESSIIPLELIFEHRNYLPSMFLFWPVAIGLERLLALYREKNRIVYRALVVFIPLLLVGLGTGTYIRNTVWSSEKLLWEDALRKAPQSARPYAHLAWTLYERRGDKRTALLFYHEALKRRKNRKSQHALFYNNIANIYFQSGDCSRAAENWEKSSEISETFYTPRYRLALALTRCNRFEEALSHLDRAIKQKKDFSKAINLKGVIRLLQNRPREALELFRQCLKLEPTNMRYHLNTGAGFYLLGDYQRAELYFLRALRDAQRDRLALLWNAKNYLAMEKHSKADSLLDELIAKLPFDELNLWLKMGFKARLYKSEIIFPAADKTLGNLLAAKYSRRLPALVQLSDPQAAENKLAGDFWRIP